MKISENIFILLSAFYLVIWLMKSPKSFEKIAIFKAWRLVFLWGIKTYFGILPLKWCIFRHGKNWVLQILSCKTYCSHWMWSFGMVWYGILILLCPMICAKDNFCFHEPIFHRQIKLISYRSGFWDLRRKLALLFST